MIVSLALALSLGQFVAPGLRGSVCHDELGEGNLCGWGYVQAPVATTTPPGALVDALQSGDKAGAWWAMRGDGTMLAGSAVTLGPSGAPTNTLESGWPVRTYTTAQNDQEPSDAALPASDFSLCTHRRVNARANVELAQFGAGGTATTATYPLELQTDGSLIGYISNGINPLTFVTTPAGLVSASDWNVLCFTYQRVGGAANNVSTIYVNGVPQATSAAQKLAQLIPAKWSTNGSPGLGGNGAVRGFFVTYKLLSAADIARIYASTAP